MVSGVSGGVSGGGSGVGYGTVLGTVGHCSGHCSVLLLAPPCPSLACHSTPYMHSSLPGQCASLQLTLYPCTPGTPTTHRCRVRTAHRVPRCGHTCQTPRGAHSGLHQGTDWPSMSPGPVLSGTVPADRHPLFTTSCHPAHGLTAIIVQ